MENQMRTFSAAVLAASLLMTNAFAATLPAGKPAGVKKAQMESPSALLIVTGLGLAGLGIGLAASSNGGGPITSTTGSVTGSQP
jgi:hypothetical protein